MTLSLMGKNPYTGLLSKFSLEFQSFVKDLGDAKSKGEEDRIVFREAAFLKEAIRKPGVPSKQQKEHIVRLIYCDMLGADVSFSYMEAVKFAQQPNLLEKRVAYSAICLLIDENNGSDYMMMNTGTIQRDLSSANVLEVCFGLLAASKVVYKDMLPAVLPSVKNLIKHKREVVRKKAVMALLKFYEIDENRGNDYIEIFQTILCDKDPAVMGVSLNGFHKFILEDPAPFKILVASFVSILKQVVERKLPEEFDFKGVPAPWIQIKLLQVLAILGSEDLAMSKMMYEVLTQCLHSVDTEQGIGCAVVYECMKTIATIYTNRALVEIAAGKAALFLVSDNYNLKYLGINALSDFINVDMSYGTRHQMVIIECLTDDDESIKKKTLDLLYRMTNGNNVKFICERLIIYLKSTVDEYVRSDLVLRITTLTEKFAPDNEWFIETMNEVFELGGDLVPVKVAYNMMAIIGEGIDEGEDCEDATEDLRRYAVMAYISILDKPVLPDILIQLACWVVGEYFDLIEDYDAEGVIRQLYKLLPRRFSDPLTQSWIISAIMKIVCRTNDPEKLIQDIDLSSLTDDARQRYREMRSVVKVCSDLESILPYDASCEDIQVDAELSFLDDFVAMAIQNGACTYSVDKIHSKKSDEKCEIKEVPSLKFGPYEEPYRRFPKEDIISPAMQKPHMEKEKVAVTVDNPVKERPTVQKWTKEGYIGSQQKIESSSSEVSTPASSESSSTKAEENLAVITVEKSAVEPRTEKIPSPSKSIKEEIAKQLFSSSDDASTTQRKRKGINPRKPKMDKTDTRKASQPAVNLLDLDDYVEAAASSPDLSYKKNAANEAVTDIQNASIIDLSDEFSGTDFGIAAAAASDVGIASERIGKSGVAKSENQIFDMVISELTPQTHHSSVDFELSSQYELNQKPSLNLMDNDAYDPVLPNVALVDETVTIAEDTTVVSLPAELKQFNHTPNPIEICANNHMRVTCQYVYQPTELAIVFFLSNQSTNPMTDVQLLTKLPSNLKAISAPVDFHSQVLESMTSCSHVISIVSSSPALNMVLSGNVIYRDVANTEKRIFVNHVVPMKALIRPLELSVEEFGCKWQNRSLHTKKGKLDVKTNVDQYIERLHNANLQPVEVIGNEIICAGKMLSKSEILLHFKVLQFVSDTTIKSESTLLNDCIMKMLSAKNS